MIDALYQTQQRCPNCGLRFDDLKGEKYQRHLDWHFKENQRAQDSSRGVSRQWYFAVEVGVCVRAVVKIELLCPSCLG